MNLGDGEESPWGDVPGNSPRATSPSQEDAAKLGKTSENVQDSKSSLAPPSSRSTARSSSARGGKNSRTPQPTRLEALDDDLGPLGPLGGGPPAGAESTDDPPELPQKEQAATATPRPSTTVSNQSRTQPKSSFPEDGDSLPSRGRPGGPNESQSQQPQRLAQPNPSVVQAAKPSFQISVGDPHKVGDLTSSHTVYQVRTKTTSKAFRLPEFEVSRRYKDFLWLYNELHISHPGVIVPPPPEKQAVGRFDVNFIESRRAAMERMLNKTAAHPILSNDSDLKLFLESDSFSSDVKQRDRRDPDMPVESKGLLGGLNLSSGSGGKFIEHDDWFLDRRMYLDTLEGQLKTLLKSTDTAIAQRKALAETANDMSLSLNNLSQVELSPILTNPLASLSDIYVRIHDLYERQAQQDVLTLGITIDEYIRLIGSIKKAFEQRQRTWHGWHNAESDLQKRRSALDKLMRQGRTQQDKMSQLQADVGDAERRAHQARLQFEDIGRGMRQELERFEKEKVEDFRMGVETFLESSVEAQKELIEMWETFLMHLDQDDEERQATMKTAESQPQKETGKQSVADAQASQTEAAAEAEASNDVSSVAAS